MLETTIVNKALQTIYIDNSTQQEKDRDVDDLYELKLL